MAVDAVASVVLQKLRDLSSEKSFTSYQVIGSQLEEMQKALQDMRAGFPKGAANSETSGTTIKEWTDEYLDCLYQLEDSIESFSLRITRQRNRLGFLMNHALFLKKFTCCKMLTGKLDKIQRRIKELNDRTPSVREYANVRPTRVRSQRVQEICFSFDTSAEGTAGVELYEEMEGMEQNVDAGTDAEAPRLGDGISASSASPTKGSPRRLVRSKSFKLSSIRDASLVRERLRYGKLVYSESFDEELLSILGHERIVPELLGRLSEEHDCNDRVIAIVGEVGSGKTMLARAVCGNAIIKERFKDARAWVTVFEECTTVSILLKLLKQVEKSEEQDGRTDEDRLKSRLRLALKSQRYLIVLDGIKDGVQWESLRGAFPDDGPNGSKIILTTCVERVAIDANSRPCRLGKLNSRESWDLFLRKVGLTETSEVRTAKDRIIQVCRGLPLNIVLLGSLLSTKKDESIEGWNEILDNQGRWDTSYILMLSYYDLDAHLKLCLLYMTLFPKDLDIPVRRLLRLWLAEGFMKQPKDEDKFREDVVQEYFDDLVKRSLIVVSKLRSDGSSRKCRLLGVLHDFLLKKARDISLFYVHHGSAGQDDGPHFKRRLIQSADGNNCTLTSLEYQYLRSYISFNYQIKDTPAKDVGNLLNNMIGKGLGLLGVLDLEGVYKPSLPENLGNLFQLRYLGLRWTFLDKLPKSVGELTYLETLDLKHTYINRIPPSIWKLKRLQHLNLNEIYLHKDMPLHSHSSLPELLTLWGLSVDHASPVKNGLSKLTHLRELGISFRLSRCDDGTFEGGNGSNTLPQFTEDLVDWISNLTTLRSLRLRSKDDLGRPADLNLKSFSRLNNLSHMNLLGKLQKLPDIHHFPPNIKVLTLSVSKLVEDPMPILGKLQSLTVLRLLANSYLRDKIVCPPGTFEELEVLKLWMLEDLTKWELEGGAMKKLKELNIRWCPKLENIPSRLLQQKTFKDLILTNMPEEFKDKVKRKINQQVSITVKNYEFTPLPWEQTHDVPNETAIDINGYANGGV